MTKRAEIIQSEVANILAAAGVSFTAQLIGPTKQEDWECDEWRITFIAQHHSGGVLRAGGEEFDYFTGTGHRVDTQTSKLAKITLQNVSRNSIAWHDACKLMEPKTPHPADVLHSIILDSCASKMTFAEWCGDYGYDTDSRKAFATYDACQQQTDKLRRIFKPGTIQALSEALQDY